VVGNYWGDYRLGKRWFVPFMNESVSCFRSKGKYESEGSTGPYECSEGWGGGGGVRVATAIQIHVPRPPCSTGGMPPRKMIISKFFLWFLWLKVIPVRYGSRVRVGHKSVVQPRDSTVQYSTVQYTFLK
jgi:hypothetical protein